MTLEKAIKRYEKYSKCIHQTMITKEDAENVCEWLAELKKWRVIKEGIYSLCDIDCEYPQYKESKTMCGACMIGQVIDHLERVFGEG